jgi:hypothetical protein
MDIAIVCIAMHEYHTPKGTHAGKMIVRNVEKK